MADMPQAEDFTPFINKTFQPAGQPASLTLVEVIASDGAGWQAASRKPFYLILRGPQHDVLPEGLYRFVVDSEAEFELYISPVQTKTRGHQDYQIAFN